MKSIWTANFGNNAVLVENNWFSGEKLYVNGELQDMQKNYFSAPVLTGHVIIDNGNKLAIKVNLIANFFSIDCLLFIDDRKVELTKIS